MSSSIRNVNLFAASDYKKVFKAYSFIDYKSYDFDSLKQALINYIQTFYPESFNDYIESSEFIAIVELLAYLGTSLAFRTDLNSRENFIDTAERRESVIRLAQMVNYVPRRNVAASGLFKIASVQTNQPLTDANGVTINDKPIFWNDANNSNWFDQFTQVCNAAFNTSNPFGRPTKSGSIGSIPTDLYELNSVTNLSITYPTTVSINGQQYPIDICNPDFVSTQTIFERAPDPANSFNLIYRNDSLGVGSANTGFFLYFRQGTLSNIDTNFDFPVPNRVYPINVQNINQDDVYVQEIDQAGNIINQWTKVPALSGQNVIYNSIHNSERSIYDTISGASDTVSIRFADGNFGDVPSGLFRTWVRVSANQQLIIRPEHVQGLQIIVPYVGEDNQQYSLRVSFNLEQTIGNSAPSETNEQIKLRAPEVFSTQSRMVNNSDYNVLPLIYGNQVAKIRAINRTYSGNSRYIDMNDPTGFHRDVTVIGDDGALYRNDKQVTNTVIEDVSNTNNITTVVMNNIQSVARAELLNKFFYDEYLTQFQSTIRVNKQHSGDAGYSLLDLNNPYQTPLFWRTSPAKFKNNTGYFATSKDPVVSAEMLSNLLDLNNPQLNNLNTYRSWGFIRTGSVVEFATSTLNGSTWVADDTTMNAVSIQDVVDLGVPLNVNPLNMYANAGAVALSDDELNLNQAIKVYPAFRTTFNTTEIAEIKAKITNGTAFWLYYDLLSDKWGTALGSTNSSQSAFTYPLPAAGEDGVYSNWPVNPTAGLIYVDVVAQPQNNRTLYNIVARGREYVFESMRSVRFFWEPKSVVVDNATGVAMQDTIEILPFLNTNNTVDNNAPHITSVATSYLTESVNFNITGTFTQSDGFTDTSKVAVSLVDVNSDGIPDDPSGFNKIVSLSDRVVFEYYTNDMTGYKASRPWISKWDRSFETYTGDLYLYFPADPYDRTSLYGSPYISDMRVANIYSPKDTLGATVLYLDTADLIFINNILHLTNDGTMHTRTLANQVTAFFNLTADETNAAWINTSTYYPWLLDSAHISNKIDILNGYVLNKSFLLADGKVGAGQFNVLVPTSTMDVINYPSRQIFVSQLDKNHFDKNGKVFTQNTSVNKTKHLPFQYKWKHYSAVDQRVDPSPTNIVDMIVITYSYYTDMLAWKSSNGTLATLPVPPTTESLRIQFQDLNQYKMVSDTMVWNSGQFKLLFGPQASPELQATFMIVKAQSTNATDYEIKTRVIQAIDTYFDIRNWDFGEQFYYTELAAYIHQQLSTMISSAVIVSNSNSQFGNLFEIATAPNQLFMSTATVNNVQIVSNYSKQF